MQIAKNSDADCQNFENELLSVTEFWSPKIIGQVNDQYIKVAKLKGELAWHKHDNENEMFYVVKGHLVIQFESHAVEFEMFCCRLTALLVRLYPIRQHSTVDQSNIPAVLAALSPFRLH